MATRRRSVFPQGPDFTLADFTGKDFLVQDFVESLSDRARPLSRRSAPATAPAAFDPKPFIRSFEHALARLASLSDDLAAHETELLTAVRRAELQHSQTIESLGNQLDRSIDAFHSLDLALGPSTGVVDGDRSIDAGGNVAVKIGEALEELDRQSRRALDARFLVQCWLEVSETGQLNSLESVRQHGGGEGKVRCAVLARQLTRISQRLDPGSWDQVNGDGRWANGGGVATDGHGPAHNTREVIEKFAETLEKDLLQQFDDFYRKQDFDGMRNCANVLYDFNGGASVIALFVNQHQFFIDRSQLITEEVDGDQEYWERLADPDAPPPPVEASLQALVDEVKMVAQEESFILKRAFPYHDLVLSKFLQRVFQQSIQQRLEMVLEKAKTVSTLAFLRSLQAAKGCINTLVDGLKTHGLTGHPEPASLQISLTLDQQVDELFVPYLVGTSSIEREKRSLEELYSSLLFKFTIYHSRKKKIPTTFMATLAKSGSEILASARDAYIERLDSSDLTPSQKVMLLRIAGLKDAESAKNKGDIDVTEEDGVLRVENVKRMLRWLAESVGRSLELSGGNDTPRDVLALLNFLLSNLGEIYIETALDAANYLASTQESSKNEPDLSYLPNLRSIITTIHLMLGYIHTVLLPLASSSITIRRQMEKAAQVAVSRTEEKVNGVMQHTVDVIVAWTGKLLQSQKKNDFRPKDGALEGGGSLWLEQLQTPTCQSVCTFLGKVNQTLSESMANGKNLSLFSIEVVTGIRWLLLDHFKKFPVNAPGGLLVTKDLTRYATTLRTFGSIDDPVFLQSLDLLTEIGNLFVIGPEALKDRLKGISGQETGSGGHADAVSNSGLAGSGGGGGGGGGGGVRTAFFGIDRAHLKPFLLKREDAGSVSLQAILNSL